MSRWSRYRLLITFLIPAALLAGIASQGALSQGENHLGIARALPSALGGLGQADADTFVARDRAQYLARMRQDGFRHVEQLGSLHVFERDGERYVATSRQYSSYLTLFSYPVREPGR